MNEREIVTRKYFFSGQVQGVGFRWTTRRIAAKYSVSGYVSNLIDGRVELVAQGEESVISEFIDAVIRHFEQNLESTDFAEFEPEEEFADFAIRR